MEIFKKTNKDLLEHEVILPNAISFKYENISSMVSEVKLIQS
jgi:hypothetical protein